MYSILQSSRIRLILFILSALCAVFVGFFAFDSKQAVFLVKTTGYWVMLFTFVLFLVYFSRCSWFYFRNRQHPVDFRDVRMPLLFIIGVSLILLVMQPTGYKITMDEPVLATTAMRMHEYKEAMATVRTHEVQGVFMQLDGYVDKRPLFFPFLVSLLHDLTGYRSSNLFLLNALLAPIFLGLLFIIGQMFSSRYGGYLAVALFATVPLLAMNINGGGFELLNLVMIMVSFMLAIFYLNAPDSPRLNLLVLSGVLLAQIRYESALYVGAVGVVIVYGWYRMRRPIVSPLLILAPLLMIPLALQQLIFSNYERLWQLKDGATQPFSPSMITHNLAQAGHFFFNLSDDQQPNSFLLSVLFLFSLAGALALRHKWKTSLKFSSPLALSVASFAAVIIANFFLLMSYHWGQLNDIIATRIVLPFILFQVFCVVAVFHNVFASSGLRKSIVYLSLVFFVGITMPVCARSDFLRWVPSQHICLWVQNQVESCKGKSVLFVSNYHLIPIVEQLPSITQIEAKQNKAQLELHRRIGTYSDILFVYEGVLSEERPGELVMQTPLMKDFDLEMIEEAKINDNLVVGIARLRGVYWRDDDVRAVDVSAYESTWSDAQKRAFLVRTLP